MVSLSFRPDQSSQLACAPDDIFVIKRIHQASRGLSARRVLRLHNSVENETFGDAAAKA